MESQPEELSFIDPAIVNASTIPEQIDLPNIELKLKHYIYVSSLFITSKYDLIATRGIAGDFGAFEGSYFYTISQRYFTQSISLLYIKIKKPASGRVV